MKLSLYVGETRDLERSLEAIVEAERRGLHDWLAPASHLAAVVLPAAQGGAERAGRPIPRIVAAVPATLAGDRRAALEGLNAAFGGIARAPSYLGMLEEELAAR